VNDPALWLRALHIMAFAAWMAGLWYLPRLFVYHSQVAAGGEASEKYKVMERRLLRGITTPAMLATILFGVALATLQGQWSAGWLHAKIALVVLLALSHGLMARFVKKFAADRRPASERIFRWFNEVPTVLFIGIVILAVFQPGR
jgi:putative membrane protein